MNYSTHGSTSGKNAGGAAPMLGQNDSGSDSATTKSGVSAGTVTITDSANQKQDVASLNRDTTNTNGTVAKLPDMQNLLANQSDMMAAASAAGEAVSRRIGDYADKMMKDAAANGDQAGVDAWKEGGANRALMQGAGAALVTGLAGGNAVGGAAGAAIASIASGKLNELSSAIAGSDPTGNANMNQALGNIVANALATGAGAAVGGEAGAFSGYNADRFNRQLHPDERKWAQDRAKDFVAFYKQKTGQDITIDQAQNMLLVNGYRLVDAAASKGPGGDSTAVAYINQNGGGLFAKDQYYNNPLMFGNKDGSPTPEQVALASNSGKSAGPGFRAPDYSSANGSGMSVAYGTSVNLHDGQIYVGGGKANPFSPSGNIMFGYLLFPGDSPTLETNNFLNGAAIPIGGCMLGVCIGLNHSIGGQTSIEFGVGTPGVSTGVTVSKPVGGSRW
ncbi:polymorphic toxin type 22 domain-containing protein [Burkholderia sp. BCC0419]|uniref:polymorphic toxin type 22 domain-containing protein n=1 Tax=Burkholderia sp. BCC0419 TaxID=486878 RepID=UPI00158AF14B|nr:polymorphic toxin type 22 domain-containing protein [Burkholderia sp. BCC0419]